MRKYIFTHQFNLMCIFKKFNDSKTKLSNEEAPCVVVLSSYADMALAICLVDFLYAIGF